MKLYIYLMEAYGYTGGYPYVSIGINFDADKCFLQKQGNDYILKSLPNSKVVKDRLYNLVDVQSAISVFMNKYGDYKSSKTDYQGRPEVVGSMSFDVNIDVYVCLSQDIEEAYKLAEDRYREEVRYVYNRELERTNGFVSPAFRHGIKRTF
jgi:hypothetical protein